MILSILADRIDEELNRDEHQYRFFTKAYFYGQVDVLSRSNPHLANPLNQAAGAFYPRLIPFTGEEELQGDYFLFDYCEHNASMVLREYDSLAELELRIIGPGGITNPFTSLMVAIVNVRIKHFDVTYLEDGNRKHFDKRQQRTAPSPFRKHYDSLQITWLE